MTSETSPSETAPTARRSVPRVARISNPLMVRFAGHRWFPLWAVVEHRGRKSGRAYEIPVALLVTPRTFVVCLPWGPQTNWVRNVVAAGGCTVRWKGSEHRVDRPEVVGIDGASEALGRFERFMVRRLGFQSFLVLHR